MEVVAVGALFAVQTVFLPSVHEGKGEKDEEVGFAFF